MLCDITRTTSCSSIYVRRRSLGAAPVTLTVKNLSLNAAYYAITLALVPATVLQLEWRWWGATQPRWVLRLLGAAVGLAGVLLQGWSIILLQRGGGGTPSPVVPPARLVTSGPYGWVRNPLNLGEVLLLAALAAWFGSWLLAVYAALALVGFHLFILMWEEPRHRVLFGPSYGAYTGRVNRLLPRRPAGSKGTAA